MSDLGTYAERVQRGIVWLDKNVPGWEHKIVLNNFQMQNSSRCVLGWTFRDEAKKYGYHNDGFGFACDYKAPSSHEEELKWVTSHGFDLNYADIRYHEIDPDSREREWKRLQREWVKVIRSRIGVQLALPV